MFQRCFVDATVSSVFVLDQWVLDQWVFVLDWWVFVLDHRVFGLRFRHIPNDSYNNYSGLLIIHIIFHL